MIAERYGGWPHEVGAFPFHYYLALREDYIRYIARRTPKPVASDDDEEVIDWDAEHVAGEPA